MVVEFLEVGFAFPYSEGCTPEELHQRLARLAACWPGWHSFPWRVTRNIHHLLRGPEAKFSYLMMQRCLTGYAAHLVLTAPFEDRDAVLRMMAGTRFEAGGLLLDLTLEAIRGEMRRTDLPYIQDASGPEDGHGHVDAGEIDRRRKAFRDAMEGMAKEFRTILNVASVTNGRPGTVCLGRRMETWARGVDMPEPVKLEVQVEDRGRYRILMPCAREIEALANAGKRVPRLIEGDMRAAREECAACGWGREGTAGGGSGSCSGSGCGQGEGAQPNAEGRRDGCEAEMVLRTRGMTVVALPAGWEAGEGQVAGGRSSAISGGKARERAATEPEGGGGKFRVVRPGKALEYDGGTYQFTGARRWACVMKLAAGAGRFVSCGGGLKGYFAKNKEAKAFFETAVEAEGAGRNGTGRYRLKV